MLQKLLPVPGRVVICITRVRVEAAKVSHYIGLLDTMTTIG